MGNWSQQKFNSDWTMEEFIECRLGKSGMEVNPHVRNLGKTSRSAGKCKVKVKTREFENQSANVVFKRCK